MKSVLHLIDLCMQIADLSLHPLISIDFDAVDESALVNFFDRNPAG